MGVSVGGLRLTKRGYTTTFPANETPLSEGGAWVHYDSTLTNVMTETIGGVHVAHGTQAGGPFAPYDDSSACLTGFSENHTVEAIVWLSGSIVEANNKEVELLLRWQNDIATHSTAYGDTSILGYEINIGYLGAYAQVGVFKGALLSSFTSLPTPATGDKFRAQIQQSGANAQIKCWWNDVLRIDYTDTAPVRGGNPGIGFYRSVGGANDKFGFSAVTAADL